MLDLVIVSVNLFVIVGVSLHLLGQEYDLAYDLFSLVDRLCFANKQTPDLAEQT